MPVQRTYASFSLPVRWHFTKWIGLEVAPSHLRPSLGVRCHQIQPQFSSASGLAGHRLHITHWKPSEVPLVISKGCVGDGARISLVNLDARARKAVKSRNEIKRLGCCMPSSSRSPSQPSNRDFHCHHSITSMPGSSLHTTWKSFGRNSFPWREPALGWCISQALTWWVIHSPYAWIWLSKCICIHQYCKPCDVFREHPALLHCNTASTKGNRGLTN